MRYYIVDAKPTADDLKKIEAAMLEGKVLGATYENKFFIAYDDEKHAKPNWLDRAEELNIPGEPHTCWNCGERYDDRPTPGPGPGGIGG